MVILIGSLLMENMQLRSFRFRLDSPPNPLSTNAERGNYILFHLKIIEIENFFLTILLLSSMLHPALIFRESRPESFRDSGGGESSYPQNFSKSRTPCFVMVIFIWLLSTENVQLLSFRFTFTR